FGGALGGPIVKDKTFFFLFYEGFRNREGETQGSTVPSLRQREGDFGELCDPNRGETFDGDGLCSNPAHQLYLIPTPPAPTPIPNNDLGGVNPFSQSLMHLFPEPNTGLNIFTSTVTKRDDFNQG